jgi:hypothetical protein
MAEDEVAPGGAHLHRVLNDLSIAVGFLELLGEEPLAPDMEALRQDALDRLVRASDLLRTKS